MFDEFYQIGEVARSRYQGLGLGLAIASRIADLLGLRIGVRSRPGSGSVFHIEVPLAGIGVQRPSNPRRSPEPVGHSGGSVLLVEDNDTVRNAAAQLLRLWGFRPLCAASAEEAYDLLRNHPETPVLALVDYGLRGGSSGIELLQRLRDEQELDLPGILVTGDTEADRLRQARASGYRLLHKPVSPDDLLRAVQADAAFRVRSRGPDAAIDNE